MPCFRPLAGKWFESGRATADLLISAIHDWFPSPCGEVV